MKKLSNFFTSDEKAGILDAIGRAEKNTSGEIRLRIEKNSGDNPLENTREAFIKLGMRETELKNGILFYLSLEDRQFAILGDEGIDEKVPENFWDSVVETVISSFKDGNFAEGLARGIELAGEQLAEYFPYQKEDSNELPDAISFEDEEDS